MKTERIKGTVKSWLEVLGQGFVAPLEDHEQDIYVNRASIPARSGRRYLLPGEHVEFDLQPGKFFFKAVNVTFPS